MSGTVTGSQRYFAAVTLPQTVLDQLERLVEPRRDPVWRWTDSTGWHVTLAFYEQVDPWRYPLLVDNLRRAAARAQPFRIALSGAGAFPSHAAAKVLYAPVSGGTRPLAGLAGHCRTAATRVGISVPRQRYQPHLTLARSRRPVSAQRYLRALAGLETDDWEVTQMVLVQSFLGQGPAGSPRYQVAQRFGLAPG